MQVTVNINNSKEKNQNLFDLWKAELNKIWPIEQTHFEEVVYHKNAINFLAKNGPEAIGFLTLQISGNNSSIVCIVVKKTYQRKGVGSKLVSSSLQYLKSKNIYNFSLGSGGPSYFWPGVPINLKPAVKFFRKMGWAYKETSVDMIRQLKTYKTPKAILMNMDKLQIKLKFATAKEIKDLETFERKNFPQWHDYFKQSIQKNNLNNILLAISSDNKILGSVLIDRDKKVWTQMLGNKVGAFGALGVTESFRGQGIGLGLAAYATEILKADGVEVCFIGWTWLIDWYAKLGYKVWRKYQMVERKILDNH